MRTGACRRRRCLWTHGRPRSSPPSAPHCVRRTTPVTSTSAGGVVMVPLTQRNTSRRDPRPQRPGAASRDDPPHVGDLDRRPPLVRSQACPTPSRFTPRSSGPGRGTAAPPGLPQGSKACQLRRRRAPADREVCHDEVTAGPQLAPVMLPAYIKALFDQIPAISPPSPHPQHGVNVVSGPRTRPSIRTARSWSAGPGWSFWRCRRGGAKASEQAPKLISRRGDAGAAGVWPQHARMQGRGPRIRVDPRRCRWHQPVHGEQAAHRARGCVRRRAPLTR